MIIWKSVKTNSTVYSKNMHCLIHDFTPFYPNSWNWETSKTLVTRRYTSSSVDQYLQDEIKDIRKTFHEINNHLNWVSKKSFSRNRRKEIIRNSRSFRNIWWHLYKEPSINQGIKKNANSMKKYVNKTYDLKWLTLGNG